LVLNSGNAITAKVDGRLLKSIARAHGWFQKLVSGKVSSVCEIADRESVTAQYVGNLLPLAFLAPKIVEAIAAGRQPPDLMAQRLIKLVRKLPLDWASQLRHLAFS